jgi:hypothetical protein
MTGRHHDLVDFTKKYKGDLYEFYLDFANWRKFKSRYKLEWKKLKFGENFRNDVPTVRGLYIFTLEADGLKLPGHGYILYVGITGDTGNANLRKRYGQYLLDLKNANGRPAVCYMLKNWSNELFFNFAELPNIAIDLAKIERDLINALIPPINKRDLEANVSAGKAAAF